MLTTAGNVREEAFDRIWSTAPNLLKLRNRVLKGKCSICEYRLLCGGCRARAYAISLDMMDADPWCTHSPDGQNIISLSDSSNGNEKTEETGKLFWTREAEDHLRMIPSHSRHIIRCAVERYAVTINCSEVTPSLMDEARRNWETDETGTPE
jgi:hypothetical protein